MKTLRETEDIACTCIHQLFAFPNMVQYLEILKFMSIEHKLTTYFNPLWVSDYNYTDYKTNKIILFALKYKSTSVLSQIL